MTKRINIRPRLFWLVISLFLSAAFAVFANGQDKTPVIIIPGITGSELINQKTGEVVWYRAPRPSGDGLRLPVSADLSKVRDNLVPRDILRSVKLGIFPRVDVYEGLIHALETKAGYHEESWDAPSASAGERSIFVFPYDWRLDNVANARLLVQKIIRLRAKLKLPKLKFNVIAHSMGGIIARYAAMYGDANLAAAGRKQQSTWAGAVYFDKLVLLGTPNEGSALTLGGMLNWVPITGINIDLPWIQKLSKFDLFTLPSAYQLLPAPGTFRVMNEDLEPMDIDVYDPAEWTKYGWNVIHEKGFDKQFNAQERTAAPVFFAKMLDRAKRLHEALAASGDKPSPVSINLVGADCKEALDTIVMIRDPKTERWKTLFKPGGYLKKNGLKVTSEELKSLMMGPGDGVVTRRSLEADAQGRIASGTFPMHQSSIKFICEEHNRLAANTEVQNHIMWLLNGIKSAEKPMIAGTLWRWVSQQGPGELLSVPENEAYSIQFAEGGEITAKVACNSGTGNYKIDGSAITISGLVTTKMQCQDASFAARFTNGLTVARAFRIEGNVMYLELPAGQGEMRFSKTDK
jgi:heat shock protein HslJ/pimeloyl-ACP methyl ester carboxylesterase